MTKTTLWHEHMTNFLGSRLRQSYFVESLVCVLGMPRDPWADEEAPTGAS